MDCVRDIEEHDVLHNPRIDSNVPDMSRVKIEPPSEEDIDNEEEDSSYYYDNVIILGSKPSPDIELLYEEAVISKYCDHCSKTFPDDTSLIQHLYELQLLNNFTKVKEEKYEPKKAKLTKPAPCSLKVKSTSHVISKIPSKKIKIEPREFKIEPGLVKDIKPKLKKTLQRNSKFSAAPSLVPKSTLIQCNVCQSGFLSSITAAQHSKMCRKVSPKKDVSAKVSPKKELAPKLSPKQQVIAKIYQCQCGLHFTSMKTIEKHLDQCGKSNLVFPTEVLIPHLINHHHTETKIVIEKIAKANLFKCSKCFVLFTNMENFNLHTENCDPNNSTDCENFGLKLGKKCFSKHLCSFGDVTYMNKVTVVRKKIVKEAVVYRCGPCDVTYLQRNSYRYHAFEGNHTIKKPLTICDVCGLKFSNCSIRKHKNIHCFSNEDYKIKVVEPESGDFEILTGNNRGKDNGSTGKRKRNLKNSEENGARDFSMDLDDTPIEFVLSNEILIDNNFNNISDIDMQTVWIITRI